MNCNDWKFIKDGHLPKDNETCWVLVYDKVSELMSVRVGVRNPKYCDDLWLECSDSSYFSCNDVIIAWREYIIPIMPEYPQLTGGEFAKGGIYGK